MRLMPAVAMRICFSREESGVAAGLVRSIASTGILRSLPDGIDPNEESAAAC
jgi:hypothetical protein